MEEPEDRSYWQRFPASAQSLVPKNIWRLSTQPSGMLVRFRTNASLVVINVTRLDFSPNTDDIFTTNGKYGIDVHLQDPSEKNFGNWRWAATEASTSVKALGSLVLPLSGVEVPPPDGLHNVTVYLPTYIACGNLTVGVKPPTAALMPLKQYDPSERPLYVWGSSIAQGGVVTNAGMTWPSNLQRILGVPMLNFGFSGSCGMQPTVAAQLAKAQPPPRALLIDCLPNLQQASATQVMIELELICTSVYMYILFLDRFGSEMYKFYAKHMYTNNI